MRKDQIEKLVKEFKERVKNYDKYALRVAALEMYKADFLREEKKENKKNDEDYLKAVDAAIEYYLEWGKFIETRSKENPLGEYFDLDVIDLELKRFVTYEEQIEYFEKKIEQFDEFTIDEHTNRYDHIRKELIIRKHNREKLLQDRKRREDQKKYGDGPENIFNFNFVEIQKYARKLSKNERIEYYKYLIKEAERALNQVSNSELNRFDGDVYSGKEIFFEQLKVIVRKEQCPTLYNWVIEFEEEKKKFENFLKNGRGAELAYGTIKNRLNELVIKIYTTQLFIIEELEFEMDYREKNGRTEGDDKIKGVKYGNKIIVKNENEKNEGTDRTELTKHKKYSNINELKNVEESNNVENSEGNFLQYKPFKKLPEENKKILVDDAYILNKIREKNTVSDKLHYLDSVENDLVNFEKEINYNTTPKILDIGDITCTQVGKTEWKLEYYFLPPKSPSTFGLEHENNEEKYSDKQIEAEAQVWNQKYYLDDSNREAYFQKYKKEIALLCRIRRIQDLIKKEREFNKDQFIKYHQTNISTTQIENDPSQSSKVKYKLEEFKKACGKRKFQKDCTVEKGVLYEILKESGFDVPENMSEFKSKHPSYKIGREYLSRLKYKKNRT